MAGRRRGARRPRRDAPRLRTGRGGAPADAPRLPPGRAARRRGDSPRRAGRPHLLVRGAERGAAGRGVAARRRAGPRSPRGPGRGARTRRGPGREGGRRERRRALRCRPAARARRSPRDRRGAAPRLPRGSRRARLGHARRDRPRLLRGDGRACPRGGGRPPLQDPSPRPAPDPPGLPRAEGPPRLPAPRRRPGRGRGRRGRSRRPGQGRRPGRRRQEPATAHGAGPGAGRRPPLGDAVGGLVRGPGLPPRAGRRPLPLGHPRGRRRGTPARLPRRRRDLGLPARGARRRSGLAEASGPGSSAIPWPGRSRPPRRSVSTRCACWRRDSSARSIAPGARRPTPPETARSSRAPSAARSPPRTRRAGRSRATLCSRPRTHCGARFSPRRSRRRSPSWGEAPGGGGRVRPPGSPRSGRPAPWRARRISARAAGVGALSAEPLARTARARFDAAGW